MDPQQTVDRLIAKATDAGSSPEEQRTCAKAAADLIKKHGLLAARQDAMSLNVGVTRDQLEMRMELNQKSFEIIALTLQVNSLQDELDMMDRALARSKHDVRCAAIKKLENELKQWRAYGAKQEALKQQQDKVA